jgi:hypothetical protein
MEMEVCCLRIMLTSPFDKTVRILVHPSSDAPKIAALKFFGLEGREPLLALDAHKCEPSFAPAIWIGKRLFCIFPENF